MSWIKVLAHDVRCGLFRWRYLLAPFLVILACLQLGDTASFRGIGPVTWADLILYIFQGMMPVELLGGEKSIELPFQWLLIMGGCLLMNLDYLLYDLTNAGQQVILRSRGRRSWYLSKCLWNLGSTGLCFVLIALTAGAAAFAYGGAFSLRTTQALSGMIFGGLVEEGQLFLTAWQVIAAGLLIPFLTVAAFSMLQMTLCLFVKPVMSFFVCQTLLVVAVFWKSPLSLGNGAMVLRSGWVLTGDRGSEWAGVDPLAAALFAGAVILICVIAGAVKFRHTDILGLEE